MAKKMKKEETIATNIIKEEKKEIEAKLNFHYNGKKYKKGDKIEDLGIEALDYLAKIGVI